MGWVSGSAESTPKIEVTFWWAHDLHDNLLTFTLPPSV